MIAILKSEWIKYRTLMSNWVLAIIAFAFPVVVVVLVAALGDLFEINGGDLAELIAGTTGISLFLMSAAAALSVTAEYAHNTIRPTFAANPNRAKVLVIKACVATAVTIATVAATVVVSWVAGSLILKSRDGQVSLDDHPNIVSVLIAVVVLGALLTWFGYGAGTILKSSALSIVFLLVWPLIIENLISVVLSLTNAEGARKWLPYQAAFGSLGLNNDPEVLGRPGGLIWFGAVAAALIVIGVVMNERRDA